jgi:hypothetical protein
MASVVLFKLHPNDISVFAEIPLAVTHIQHRRKGTMKILMSIIRLGMTNSHHLNHDHLLQLLNELSTIRIALPR